MDTKDTDQVGLPHFTCTPAEKAHTKAFHDTAAALTKLLCSLGRTFWEVATVLWCFLKLSLVYFWEIRGRCWWHIAKNFTEQGLQAVKKDAFRG